MVKVTGETVETMWDELLNKKISVLIEGLSKKEAYTGKLLLADGEWVILQTGGSTDKIDRVYIRTRTILSVLRYTEDFKTEVSVQNG